MTQPPQSLRELRQLTPARVGLGRVGAGLPTRALLEFTLDHARARDAVHAALDIGTVVAGLEALGLATLTVSSCAVDRAGYLRRPDLGRRLDGKSRQLLAERQHPGCDLAIAVGDGLSPAAVNAHALDVVRALLPRLQSAGIEVGPAVVATGARVALGDEIGALTGARVMVMLIGERPGLSAPTSLGAYLTFAPQAGRTDAERNCVSNIHTAGLRPDEAAFKIAWLVRQALARRISGVALKDESGNQPVLLATGEGGAT
jgi:ethanolamine ammonia-lyase small subunit